MIELRLYPNNFWGVADVFSNGERIAKINKFYDVTEDWIIIYDAVGGSGTGWSKGNIIRKIFIGDKEFKTTEQR